MQSMIEHPLGDGLGSIEVIDYMGDDLRVANAARVSMKKRHDSFDFEKDTKLIKYLSFHKHWTPFSHCMVTLHIKMPIFLARQWFKHQVGFTRNEVSRRYVDDTPEFYNPAHWRLRADNVKQGSSDVEVEGCTECLNEHYNNVVKQYMRAVNEENIAPEMARMVLPQSMYTEFYETASLAAYARLVGLRNDPHAQKEIQLYARSTSNLMEQLFPISWKALTGE